MASENTRNGLSAVLVQAVRQTGAHSDRTASTSGRKVRGPNTGFNGLPSTANAGIWDLTQYRAAWCEQALMV